MKKTIKAKTICLVKVSHVTKTHFQSMPFPGYQWGKSGTYSVGIDQSALRRCLGWVSLTFDASLLASPCTQFRNGSKRNLRQIKTEAEQLLNQALQE